MKDAAIVVGAGLFSLAWVIVALASVALPVVIVVWILSHW